MFEKQYISGYIEETEYLSTFSITEKDPIIVLMQMFTAFDKISSDTILQILKSALSQLTLAGIALMMCHC